MSIRDEAIEDLLSIKGMTEEMLQAVLTHPNVAIIDPDAELPTFELGTIGYEELREGIKQSIDDAWCEAKHKTWGEFKADSASRILKFLSEFKRPMGEMEVKE